MTHISGDHQKNRLTEFFTPKFSGRRFELHTLPLSILKDIGVIQDIIFEIAKNLYKQKNPEKKRLPKNLKRNLEIHLSNIDKGSAKPKFNFLNQEGELFPPAHHLLYEEAYEVFVQEISAANDPEFNTINREIYYLFDSLGRGLEEDEYIEFPKKGPIEKSAFYNKDTRRNLRIKADKSYTEGIYLRGRIVKLDQPKSVFGIKLEHKKGEIIECSFSPSIRQDVLLAIENYENGVYKIYGTATFDIKNDIELVSDVDEIEAIAVDDAPYQIIKLFSRKSGWYDGAGIAIHQKNALTFCNLWDKYYSDQLPNPLIYLNLDGNLELEWDFDSIAISCEIDIQEYKCDLLISRLDNAGIISTDEFSVKEKEGFERLAEHLTNYYKGE